MRFDPICEFVRGKNDNVPDCGAFQRTQEVQENENHNVSDCCARELDSLRQKKKIIVRKTKIRFCAGARSKQRHGMSAPMPCTSLAEINKLLYADHMHKPTASLRPDQTTLLRWRTHELVNRCEDAQHYDRVLRPSQPFTPETVRVEDAIDTWQDPEVARDRTYVSVYHGLLCEQVLYSQAPKQTFAVFGMQDGNVRRTDLLQAVWQLQRLHSVQKNGVAGLETNIPWPEFVSCSTFVRAALGGEGYTQCALPFLWVNVYILAYEQDGDGLHRVLVSDGIFMVWVWLSEDPRQMRGKCPWLESVFCDFQYVPEVLRCERPAIRGGSQVRVYRVPEKIIGRAVCMEVMPWERFSEPGSQSMFLRGHIFSTAVKWDGVQTISTDELSWVHTHLDVVDIKNTIDTASASRLVMDYEFFGPEVPPLAPTRDSVGGVFATATMTPNGSRTEMLCVGAGEGAKADSAYVEGQWQLLPAQWEDLTRGSCSKMLCAETFRGFVKLHAQPFLVRARTPMSPALMSLVLSDGVSEREVHIDEIAVEHLLRNVSTGLNLTPWMDGLLSSLQTDPLLELECLQSSENIWAALSAMFCEAQGREMLLDVWTGVLVGKAAVPRLYDFSFANVICLGSICGRATVDGVAVAPRPDLLGCSPTRTCKLLLLAFLKKIASGVPTYIDKVPPRTFSVTAQVMLPEELFVRLADHLPPPAWMLLARSCKTAMRAMLGEYSELGESLAVHYVKHRYSSKQAANTATYYGVLSSCAFKEAAVRACIEPQQCLWEGMTPTSLRASFLYDLLGFARKLRVHACENERDADVSESPRAGHGSVEVTSPLRQTRLFQQDNETMEGGGGGDGSDEDVDEDEESSDESLVNEFESDMMTPADERLLTGFENLKFSEITFTDSHAKLMTGLLRKMRRMSTWGRIGQVLNVAEPLSIFTCRCISKFTDSMIDKRFRNATAWSTKSIDSVGPGSVYHCVDKIMNSQNDEEGRGSDPQACTYWTLLPSAFRQPVQSMQAFEEALTGGQYDGVSKWRVTGVVRSVTAGSKYFVRSLSQKKPTPQGNGLDGMWRLAHEQAQQCFTLAVFDGDMMIPVTMEADLFEDLRRQVNSMRELYGCNYDECSSKSQMRKQIDARMLRQREMHNTISHVSWEQLNSGLNELTGCVVEVDVYEHPGQIYLGKSHEEHTPIGLAVKFAVPYVFKPQRLREKEIFVIARFQAWEHARVVHTGWRNMNLHRVPDNLTTASIWPERQGTHIGRFEGGEELQTVLQGCGPHSRPTLTKGA